MKQISFYFVVSILLFTFSAEAQQPTKIPRVGFLSGTSLSVISARVDAFREGLREVGYVEGKNIFVEWRYAERKPERLSALATELVRLGVDLVVTAGPAPTRAAKKSTATIPIVMAFDDDPVANGFVSSLARPGGNTTGLATLAPEISGKQMELLKEIIPRLSRVAFLGTSTNPGYKESLSELEIAAGVLGLKLQSLDVLNPKDIEIAFRTATKEHADAILVLGSGVVTPQRTQIIDLAAKNRLPGIYARPEFVEEGGLVFYGASYTDLFRRAAAYVDKILKGAKPAELPVEQPTKFELIINLKTAKQIGLTIPPNVLARADRVIR